MEKIRMLLQKKIDNYGKQLESIHSQLLFVENERKELLDQMESIRDFIQQANDALEKLES